MVDGERIAFVCRLVGTWAHGSDDGSAWFHFADSCVPDGWTISESPPPECPNL